MGKKSQMPKRVIVVGGGLAGLACAMKLAEEGLFVDIVSLTKVRRSHSVCAQGGINAALNTKNEGDSPLIHAYDTIKGGDFLADQPPVVEMCLTAPAIIRLLDRIGCPFNRTAEGHLDVRRFGGTLYHRTVFCGASTGQQLLYALDEQVRRFEAAGRVTKRENHEFLRLILDEKGQARGVVVMNLFNQALEALKADAVVIATGGLGVLFKKSTNSTTCTGVANGRLFMQGMWYANPEFIQIHPTAIPGDDKLRLMSESARGEGGRIWVVGDGSKKIVTSDGREIRCGESGQPWYFLEDLYPAYGNLVPRDIAAREILRVCEMGLGIDGKAMVYLDVSHLGDEARKKLSSILEIYQKFTGQDPTQVPMKIFPAVHYSMGGGWVDWPAFEDPDRTTRYRQMTNIPGCFNIGESDFQYHGANRLGANSLLSCIFSGLVAAGEIPGYIESMSGPELSSRETQEALSSEEIITKELLNRRGKENYFALHEEVANLLIANVTVKRSNKQLQETLEAIKSIRERARYAPLADTGPIMNQTMQFARQFEPMLELALAITKGALLRNESRGAHAKVEFPNRDDQNWLKTTIATYAPDEPKISYRPVDARYVKPVQRDYTTAKKVTPHFEGLPKEIQLPL